MTRRRLIAGSTLLVLFLATAPVWAQVTTGRLIATVVDDEGAALPGVTVTIASPALIGGEQTRVTGDRGEFAFIGIAPGEYTVRAELIGFIPQERARVKVSLGRAVSLTIALPQGTFSGEIVVIDETPVVDPTQVNTGQIFDQSYMQSSAIGSVNRDYLVVVNQAAGVAGGGSWGMPQPRVFGSTIGENAYFIDGMDTTDPVTATATLAMNFDAVGEIEIQTGGFEAEFGRATGGIINLVTRSGGNRFSGTLDIRLRDDSFQESGEKFDTSQLDSRYGNSAATLGGPIVRDRVWFFASYQWINDQFTPIASPTTRDREAQNYVAKITWQINPRWRATGKFSTDPANTDNNSASRWRMPEAVARAEGATAVISGELSSVLSDSLLWNTTLGLYRFEYEHYPQSGDLQTIAHYNVDTLLSTHNYENQQDSTSRRNDVTSDLTWFVDELAGSHELKGGLEYSDLGFDSANCYTGTPNGERCMDGVPGFLFWDIEYGGGPQPYSMFEIYTSGPTTYTGAVSTAFVQDAWRVTRDLTLKIGLRYDRVTYDTNTGAQIADMDMAQPRLGLAWDMAGNAKNVLRGSWGRFMHPNALTLPLHLRAVEEPLLAWGSCSGVLPIFFGIPVSSPDECAAVASNLGWDYRLDNAGWDSFGWVLAPWNVYGSEPNRGDPDLRAAYADQLILAYEREVGQRASVELTFVDKKTRDIVDDTCNGNWPTPSVDAACDYYFFANLPELKRDYRAVIVRYETRTLDWLTLLASYTYSASEGSVEYTQNMSQVTDVYPWHYHNRYGYLSDHRTHRLKLNGFFSLKGDWTIAFDGYWTSPFTWTPYEDPFDNLEIPWGNHFLEPRGNRDASNTYQLDLQLSKGFTIGRVRLALIGSVYNAFSDEQATQVCEHISGCGFDEDGSPFNMGDPTNWQTPRRYEIGFRVEF